MTLPKTLQEKRDREAEKYVTNDVCYGGLEYSLSGNVAKEHDKTFKAGWNACHAILLESGEELDEALIKEGSEFHCLILNESSIPHGNRDEPAWVYSLRDAEKGARWAWAKAQAKMAAKDAEIKELDAKLKEAEGVIDGIHSILVCNAIWNDLNGKTLQIKVIEPGDSDINFKTQVWGLDKSTMTIYLLAEYDRQPEKEGEG